MRCSNGLLLIAALPLLAQARGVTPYLPLNLDPQAEREIERVLILGDKPALRRPIPGALVVEALPRACRVDEALCERVKGYLRRYMQESGLQFLSIEGSVSQGADVVIPNAHGEGTQSHYQVALAGYLQLGDHALLNLGGVYWEGKPPTPTGSVLSLGFDFAQLDLGYRDRWWSPMSDSSMLISTEAPTMPSITLSNYSPLTPLGIQYEIFVARMSYSRDILTVPVGAVTQGYPKMAGLHVSLEPASGWAIGAGRLLVFGGGAAGGQSVGDVLDAFFDPNKAQTVGFGKGRPVVGKQEAAVSSQFIFPGRLPFTVYAEYAANDTSRGSNLLFGKPDLSIGIHLPRLGRFDVTFESSAWAPTWYVHTFSTVQTGYGDGITNEQRTIGHWFGDQRLKGDAVGGESEMIRIGYEPHFGGRFELQARMLRNDSYYSAIPYKHEYLGSLSYAHPWGGYAVGAQIDAGRDVLGGTYGRLSGFLRVGDALSRGGDDEDYAPSWSLRYQEPGAEVFVDLGANGDQVLVDILNRDSRFSTRTEFGPHLGIGARRQVSAHQDLGMRLDAEVIQGHLLLGVRAVDYRWRFDNSLAFGLFFGAARYNLATPAFGWYMGGGPEIRNVLPGWDLAANFAWGEKVARLRTQPSDPFPLQGRMDAFYDIYSVNVHLSRKF